MGDEVELLVLCLKAARSAAQQEANREAEERLEMGGHGGQ